MQDQKDTARFTVPSDNVPKTGRVVVVKQQREQELVDPRYREISPRDQKSGFVR